MQEHDFGRVDEVTDFKSVPAGEYTVRIGEVRVGVTRDGAERWGLKLVVATGDFAGRTAAWDGLVWSERGLPRVKHVLGRLGFDVSGTLRIEPEDLVGLEVHVILHDDERIDPISGRPIQRLKVPFTGYESVANGAAL